MHVFDRAVALLNELIDLYRRSANFAITPGEKLSSGKDRRLYRRAAGRLRRGTQKPVLNATYTAEGLAELLERTAERDDLREETSETSLRIGMDIGELMREDAEAVREAFDAVFLETQRLAMEHGPGTEPDRRWEVLQRIARASEECMVGKRRQRKGAPSREPSRDLPLVPAEILDAVPDGADVVWFPSEDEDPESPRMVVRIGLGASQWIAGFACGETAVSTMFIMPNGKHYFVSALGAGYIIDLESRTLVERTGTGVVGVHRDGLMSIFLIEHNAPSLEAFGVVSRLWKTGPLGAGGLRNIALMEDCVVGEAQQATGVWTAFAVNVVTGEVMASATGPDSVCV